MQRPILVAVVFFVGVAAGALLTSLLPRLLDRGKRSQQTRAARKRILAGIKQHHDREILDEIFKAAEALHGEIDRSVHGVRRSTERLLTQVYRGER